jgi:hypothetical protein
MAVVAAGPGITMLRVRASVARSRLWVPCLGTMVFRSAVHVSVPSVGGELQYQYHGRSTFPWSSCLLGGTALRSSSRFRRPYRVIPRGL